LIADEINYRGDTCGMKIIHYYQDIISQLKLSMLDTSIADKIANDRQTNIKLRNDQGKN